MTFDQLDAEIRRLHAAGDRLGVVDLMRKYGMFSDETVVQRYLSGDEADDCIDAEEARDLAEEQREFYDREES